MLFVLRHGETEWNRLGRFQGQQNSPLTQRGERQAAAMGRLLRDHLLDPPTTPIWVGPLGRAQQSCDQVCTALGIDRSMVRTSDALKEVDFGAWEGLNATQVALQDRDAYDRRNSDKFLIPPPGGECYRDVLERVSAWLKTVDREQQTVVIAHGSLNRMLVSAATVIAPKRCLEEVPLPQDAILQIEGQRWNVLPTDFVDKDI